MLSIRLSSILVNDQARARRFYTETLGFAIKWDVPVGPGAWVTVAVPGALDGMEFLLESTSHPASVAYHEALYAEGIPVLQLCTKNLRSDHANLVAKGVDFVVPPTVLGSAEVAHFDDTCGNIIRLIQG